MLAMEVEASAKERWQAPQKSLESDGESLAGLKMLERSG